MYNIPGVPSVDNKNVCALFYGIAPSPPLKKKKTTPKTRAPLTYVTLNLYTLSE